jgi:bifunctional non-homologous end joining protein LigD
MSSRIEITHPDRLLFPGTRVTKRALAEYYARVAPLLLPHIAGRPLSFVRCPEGIRGSCFYQKHWSGDRPAALDVIVIRQADGARKQYLLAHSVDGLVALVQFGVIEIHAWGAREDALDRPDRVVFDLDPGPGVEWGDVRTTAKALRSRLRRHGLESWVKTTGGKGLHVVAPIRRGPSWDATSDFARAVARELVEADPRRFTATAGKSRRRGKIFIDWLRNVRGATSVVPWSVRARPGAPVAAAWTWSRLASLRSADQVKVDTMRIGARATDPWQGLLRSGQRLRSAP